MADPKFTNRLIHETSPYLLQHAHNPVDWYPWCEEALNKAEHENKLIFLSIGYSSCHWCHVMEHESFEDESVAAYLNEHFVPIKVDREERPDLDNIYMEAVQLMTGQGGWPLNVWLSPNLIPVYGGTYFPPADRYNLPGFMTVLKRLVDLYKSKPESLHQRLTQIQQALQTDLMQHVESSQLKAEQLHTAANIFKKSYDFVHGGFGPAPKFPSAMGIEFLFHYYFLFNDEQAKNMGLDSLNHMIDGGIYDHIGGGFHRYSTDNEWLVPHFEKMLYDNALILSSLCDAYQLSGNTKFRDTIYLTIDFLKREMMSTDDGFFSAIDADSENLEGSFYVWKYTDIKNILTKDEFSVFASYYDITPNGNWEGKNIPNRIRSSDEYPKPGENEKNLIESSKKKLLDLRGKRKRPETDTKIITSWNALTLKAYCKCYRIFGENEWKDVALNLARFLLNNMFDGKQLFRTYNKKKTKQSGFLDDYALLSEALTYVFEISGDEYFLDQAVHLSQLLIDHFYDPDNSSFFYTSHEHELILTRPRDTFDHAVPSGNSAAISALQRVGHLAGNNHFMELAHRSLGKLSNTATKNALSFGYFLNSLATEWEKGPEIIIVGPESGIFARYWAENYFPNSFLITCSDLSDTHQSILAGKKALRGKTTAYICKNFSCQKPVTDLKTFKHALRELL